MGNLTIAVSALMLVASTGCTKEIDDGEPMGVGGSLGTGGMGGGGQNMVERHHCDDDADCENGPCQAVPNVPGATRYCLSYLSRAETHCADGVEAEEGACCSDMDCLVEGQQGVCVDFLVGYCGGVPPPEIASCRFSACQTGDDCEEGHYCVPAGFPGSAQVVNYCLAAQCATDADCPARAGGQCRLLSTEPHCYGTYGLTCTYDDDPCRESGDCELGYSCVATSDGTQCQAEQPVP